MHTITLDKIQVPDFGLPDPIPSISKEEYETRIQTVQRHMPEMGLDFLVVYGDREHSANISFLTGYDPRFEEALVIIGVHEQPWLLVGNEGVGYSNVSPLEIHKELYQTFSLLGQARDCSKTLETIFRDYGIRTDSKVGAVGWKYFDEREIEDPAFWLDIPSFIADTLRQVSGNRENVTNATALFMNPDDGLRVINSVDQMAVFEAIGCYCSQGVRNLITQLKPGMTELQALQLMGLNGIPLSCHPMLGSGERARLGMMSPSDNVLKVGDIFTTCLGLQGGLMARAGFLVHGADELPSSAADYLEVVAKPYYAAAVAWWESLSIGAPASQISATISEYLNRTGVGLALNPGHLLHLDEWLHSPFYNDSPYSLKSGMVLQCDIIPTVSAPYASSNVEDGLALADETLRSEFARKYPAAWERIQMRRQFMHETLGFTLKPEVLPFSNWPAVLNPFVLDSGSALRIVG